MDVCLEQGEIVEWQIGIEADDLLASVVFRAYPTEPKPEPQPEQEQGQPGASEAASAALTGKAVVSVVLRPVNLKGDGTVSGAYVASGGPGVLSLVLDNTVAWVRSKTVTYTLRGTALLSS